jgi:hypothetical protein
LSGKLHFSFSFFKYPLILIDIILSSVRMISHFNFIIKIKKIQAYLQKIYKNWIFLEVRKI